MLVMVMHQPESAPGTYTKFSATCTIKFDASSILKFCAPGTTKFTVQYCSASSVTVRLLRVPDF